MAQTRGDDVSQDVRDILEARTALGEKIGLIEQRVQQTVAEARTTIDDIIDHVKDSTDDFLDKAKETFDPTYQVDRHPWIMLTGAVVIGYVLGTLEARARATGPRLARASAPSVSGPVDEEAPSTAVPRHANIWEVVRQDVSSEIEHAKEALLTVSRTFVRDFFQELVPSAAHMVFERVSPAREGVTRPGHGGNGSEHRGRT